MQLWFAHGFHADSLVCRDARNANWQRGLKEVRAVVCDLATAAELPKAILALPFRLIFESSLAELLRYQQFISSPINFPPMPD